MKNIREDALNEVMALIDSKLEYEADLGPMPLPPPGGGVHIGDMRSPGEIFERHDMYLSTLREIKREVEALKKASPLTN